MHAGMERRALCVAEKPSVAKEISSILSNGTCIIRPGLSKYNRVYEFAYEVEGIPCQMVMTSVSGHVMALDFTDEHKSWSSCDPSALFAAPITKYIPEDKIALKRTLEREARSCHYLLLWLDCDREGENIAFEVIDICRSSNQHLQLLRAHFSALIPRDIHHACHTFTAPNQQFSDAVDARTEIDLRLGASFTRFQTLRLQKKFPLLKNSVVSYGPCQFPTLGFVVERWLAKESFIAEPFWKIEVIYNEQSTSLHTQFLWKRGRLFDEFACRILYEICARNPTATVTHVSSKHVSKSKPLPLSTVAMQKLASKHLHMSSKRTMEIAELLYNKGFISYPRTETEIFKEGTNFPGIIGLQAQNPTWGAFATYLLNGGFGAPRSGTHNDNSHPPIHPTKNVTESNSITSDERRLYELIVRHFLACCSLNAEGNQSSLSIVIADEMFNATGLVITALNYLEVYPYDRWPGQILPNLSVGESFQPTTLRMSGGHTTAPSLLTEANLISCMDKNGIGTDATIAQHITTIQDRCYAEKVNNVFVPTALGIALVKAYDWIGNSLSKPTLRAAMETALRQVSEGTRSKAEFLDECLTQMRIVYLQVVDKAWILDCALSDHYQPLGSSVAHDQIIQQQFSVCGNCHRCMQLQQHGGSDATYVHCTICNKSWSLPTGSQLTFSPHQQMCIICGFQAIEISNLETGRTYTLCPSCYNSSVNIEDAVYPNGIQCYKCPLSTCTLSRGSCMDPVRACPSCRTAPMVLRRSKNGQSFFLSCKSFPKCKHSCSLPSAVSVVVSSIICDNCSHVDSLYPVKKLVFVFKPGVIPRYMSCNYVGCIICDPNLLALAEANVGFSTTNAPRSSISHNNNGESRNNPFSLASDENRPANTSLRATRGSSSASSRTTRGKRSTSKKRASSKSKKPTQKRTLTSVKCFICHGTGHYANRCPKRKH